MRFITPGLEAEIYRVIEDLINTIGSPQIAIDERHTPKLYSRFLRSLLVKHKRDGAARGRMHQQGPPTQQVQTGSGPVYQQPQQPHAPPSISSYAGTGVSSGASTSNLPQTTTLNNGATASNELADAVPTNTNEPGNFVLQSSPDFMFGVQGEDDHQVVDFTFDTIMTPGNDEMLAAMHAIQGPTFWQTMMMPGSVETFCHHTSHRSRRT